jgi:amino acid adenylation domain-containing protein
MSALFHDIFARHVSANPDAVAVEFEDQQLTYRQLAGMSARLAADLGRRGVAPDTVVGIAATPSLELPVAIMAVMLAGGAWLPLDLAYPAERVHHMVADSGITLLVSPALAAGRFVTDDVKVVQVELATAGQVDAELASSGSASGPHLSAAEQVAPRVEAANLAYVIYTSGSTGRPKGVALTHGGLANLAAAQAAAFGIGPGARVLQFAPSSFDASVFEIVMAFHAGATLVLAPRDDLAPGPGLTDFLAARHITHVTLPPSVLATLPVTPLPDLSMLVCAGEAVPEYLVDRWSPGRLMFNAYGPTETTVWATLAHVSAGGGKPAIGTAVSGVRTRVVDERLRLVAPGTPGELAIGGLGVARGYLGRPGLTAQCFVPDPDPAMPGGRMYRTGDLVVEHPGGALEFLGRLDHQVKVRGFRVEPQEVAALLAGHPAVTDAVVIARQAGVGTHLVGYVTSARSGGSEPGDLRAYLAERLPSYMVPSIIVPLEQMPLTPSGKIDRAALPEPGHHRSAYSQDEYIKPGTATERALAGFLAGLLSIDAISAADDFFALGGHSLLAGRLSAKVRAELGAELPMRQIFEARTIAAMAAYIDSGRTGHTPAVPPIKQTPPGAAGPAPLSFPQERVWFLEQLSPGNLAYNAQATLRLRGPLDHQVLSAALGTIVARHEVLRSVFTTVDGTPVQVPQRQVNVTVPLIDLSGLPEDQQQSQTSQALATATGQPFDLSSPPLARWVLIRHAADDHTLVHVEQHLVHDGWSFAVFLRELAASYPALAQGKPVPLPDLPVQYGDFARWQRDWIRGPVLDAYLEHWTAELEGCPALLDLPADRPRPVTQSFRGATIRVELPAALCRRLRSYSRSRGVTLFTTMLAGFATLMSRHSGQHDVVIGSGVANRRLAEIEQMIGMVVNTLPLRIDLSDAPAFDELTGRVHHITARAHEWQDVPLDRLIDVLGLPRDPARNPLFQAMFSFHDSQLPELDFAGVRGTVLEQSNNSAKTDLNVVVLPRAEQRVGHNVADDTAPITLIWEYATDLFNVATMRAMAEHYQTLLDAAVTRPGVAIDVLPLLPAAAQDAVTDHSCGAVTSFPASRTIPEIFADQVATRPDAVALVCANRTYRYAELDQRANQVACLLKAHNVGRDVPVGVLLERDDQMIIALLAVLKAGGGYLPLDPGYPAERLRGMLSDAAAPVVVTRSDLWDKLSLDAATVIKLDEAAADLAAAPITAPASAARPGSMAYVLFTSGSTGRPKGVVVEHRSVLRLVCQTDYMAFGPDERIAQVADASFDAFTFEVWGALLHGGAVCVISNDMLLAPGGLARALRDHRATSMFLTSALFTEVMNYHPGTFAGMTNLLVGGDALNVGRVRALLEQSDRPARLINGYGPTETTTFAVCHLIESLAPDATSVPIGRPIANTSGYVLDQHLRPVPAGVRGELYIGGPGVARGYANRPALTAQRFLPDPFAGDGARMYRTGDMVRYRSDGLLEFLGRIDNQVKIRGFRVEPGELEAALTAFPAIDQAVVVPYGEGGDRRLAAYLVPASDATDVSAAELRAYLTATLPPYLLPSAFITMQELPLTRSGKVDRTALPLVEHALPAADHYQPPATPTEQILAGLVAEMTGAPQVGVTDDFFAIGGNSLLAMRLVNKANERFAANVKLSEFLRAPTVAVLAAQVDATRDTGRAGGRIAPGSAQDDQRLLDQLPELSDADVDALLRKMTPACPEPGYSEEGPQG